MDFRYETDKNSREFHKQRRAFIIYNNEILFIQEGSEMSHWEFCKTKNISRDNFRERTRGYFFNGDVVFYKDNFVYDNNVIKEGLKYIDTIMKECNAKTAKIYFGLIIGNPGEHWIFDYYYGEIKY